MRVYALSKLYYGQLNYCGESYICCCVKLQYYISLLLILKAYKVELFLVKSMSSSNLEIYTAKKKIKLTCISFIS